MSFSTNEPSQIKGLEGYQVDPLFTVGDTIGDYTPPGILDGIGAFLLNETTVRFYVNHELGNTLGYAYDLANGTSLTGARVSYFDVDKSTRQIIGSGLAYDKVVNRAGNVVSSSDIFSSTSPNGLDTPSGFNRFCSAVLFEAHQFGAGNGLTDRIYFANEESGTSANDSSQYALDIATNTLYAVPWMGYAGYENVAEIDTGTTEQVAFVIGDDRSTVPMILYVGQKDTSAGAGFLERNGLANGKLYVWVADDPNDPSDAIEADPRDFKGTNNSINGKFVEIDYYRPDLAGNGDYDFQGFATQAKQDSLAADANAFLFARIEDVSTNPFDGSQFAANATGRDSAFDGADSWGTVYKFDVDFNNINTGDISAKIDILYDGDDADKQDAGLRSPDNLSWAKDGKIYLQEDRSIGAFGQTSGQEASIFRLDPFAANPSETLTRVAQVDRTGLAAGQTDASPTDIGNWETSGILDVSHLFDAQPGELLVLNVQAHSVRDGSIITTTNIDGDGDGTATREENLVEGGQLVFLSAPKPNLLTKIGGFASTNGAEIPAFDPGTDRLFVVAGPVVEILDFSNPTNPSKISDLALNLDGLTNGFSLVPNSVAMGKAGTPSAGVVAVALAVRDDLNNQEAGQIQFFDAATGNFLGKATVGFLPDMVTFSPDGTKVLTANEGEPNEGYTVDPVGSVSVVDITSGFTNPVAQNASFESFNSQKADLQSAGVRLFGEIFDADGAFVRQSTVAEDLEPEYIAFNADGTKAWVTLQENNAFAVVDIATATVEAILPLGFKDHSLPGNGLDASDRDDGINIQNWPIFGMYMPDTIASFTVGDQTYYVTANEGDARIRPTDDDILPAPLDGEGDIFSEESRIKDLILDPVAFPNAAELQADSAIGRLTVTTKLGDTDGDGDFDQLYAFGSRSFSIWDSNGSLVYDSGDDLEQITADNFPDFFNASNDNNELDNRSDNKGPEPEGVAVGTINGHTYAFVGLERVGGVMVYDVTNPESPEFVQYINTRDFAVDPESNLTDSGPEGLVFINGEDSPNGQPLLVVTNEVSKTTAVFEVNVPTPQPFTLQLFHTSDQEAGVPALDDAPRFSAVLNALLQQDIDNDGVAGFANNLILSSGDAYIPGLFLGASEDVFGGAGRGDILIQNELGFQAIAFGNHEFDLGTGLIADLIGGNEAENFPGANFPYLSGNLDFSTDANLAPLVTADGQEASTIPGKIAASTIITVNGEKIGIVGATTPTLRTISSPGDVTVNPQPFDGAPTAAQLDALAVEIQADVDALLLANPGLNKVVLLAHMQQIGIEEALATRLKNVDIIVAGGSNTRLLDENDRLRAGDAAQGIYPIIKTDADGNPVAVVNTDGNYKYLGRLVIDFNENGVIIPESYDPNISGAYATDDQGVADLNAAGLIDPEIQGIVDQLREVIVAKESNVFGVSNVYLEGLRPAIRQQETNLGNLTADANLAIAKAIDSSVVISLKNGGGIRNAIGQILVPTGGTGEPERLPNEAVTDADGNIIKPLGGISETDIANALSFNNGLSLITVTAAELLALLEHGVAASDGSNQQGRFPQVSGLAFSFDLDRAPGDRILSLAIEDETGKDLDVLVKDGELVGDASRTFRMVTLGFLATGGDGYPFPSGDSANLVDLNLPADAPRTGEATFAADGSEQDALAEYLAANFNSPENAFNKADTAPDLDARIQNLNFREDTVIDPIELTFNPIGTFTTPQLIGINGYSVDPIFTVGEADPTTNYAPPGILDGLGAFAFDSDTVRVLANHELSANAGYTYQLANGTSLTGARVSYFDVNTESREIEGTGLAYDTIINRAGEVVDSADDLEFGGLNRLCSAQYIEAGQFAGRGLVDSMFFTGEETDGGTEYVLDPTSNTLYAVPWMGVAAWESVTELDTGTTDKVALLIGDDRGGAPLLLYVGDKGQGEGPEFLVRNGLAQGKLYVWVASTGETTPEEFNGTGQSRGGSFVEIDHYRPELAGTEGYDALGFVTQEKQDTLAAEAGAFKFSRPEDLATSPTDGTVAVLASTGRDSLFPSDSWGTTYIIDADFSDLNNITADINAIYDGDDAGVGQFTGPDFGLRSPDNLEWADDGQIYIQEDRSIDEFGLTSGEEASIWRLDPNSGLLTRVGQINRDAVPEGQVDGAPTDIGNWESSGIIDVSSLFGEAAGSLFLFDVQAHSLGGGIIEDAGLVQGGQLAFLSIDPVDPIANEIGVLAEDGFFFVLLPDGGGEVGLKFENQLFAANTFGNWQILEAETVNGINQVLWQNPDLGQFGTWNADGNWNWISSETWPTNSVKTLEAEVTFQIDLNNDELLGDRLTTVETQGSTTLLEGILGNYYVQSGDDLTTPIKYLGEAFDNIFGDWQGLAAETIDGVNRVLFENQTTNQVGVWSADATWNWLSSDVFASGSPEALAQSAIFGVDINMNTVA